jgi:hypothetical protein
VVGSSSGGGSGAAGGAGSAGSAGTAGSGGSGGTGGSTGSDGGTCVDIALSTYSRSCDHASDCIKIMAGEVCDGECDCGGDSAVSASEQSRYDEATSSIRFGKCECPVEPNVQCIAHTCTIADEAGDSGITIDDGSVSVEGSSTCVDIELSSYDRSCTTASDCIEITSGEICPGSCECGGSTINKDGQAKYEAAISGIKTAACPCAAGPLPECVHGKCTMPLPP